MWRKFSLIICVCISQNVFSQLYIHGEAIYNIGSPFEISGHNYDYSYSAVLDAITEDIEAVRGGFGKGWYASIGIGNRFESGLGYDVGYDRLIYNVPTHASLVLNFYVDQFAKLEYQHTLSLQSLNFCFTMSKQINTSTSIRFFIGPSIGRADLHEKIVISNSFNSNWGEIEGVYEQDYMFGFKNQFQVSQYITERLSYFIDAGYEHRNMMPDRYYLEKYFVDGEDQVSSLPRSEREIIYKHNARVTYIGNEEEVHYDKPSERAKFTIPSSGFYVGLGLSYDLRSLLSTE